MKIYHLMPYYVTCIIRATCNITRTWIIIFSTYNFRSLYISCQYINQAYTNMIFTHNIRIFIFSVIPYKYSSQNQITVRKFSLEPHKQHVIHFSSNNTQQNPKTLVSGSKPSLKHSTGLPGIVLKIFNI